MRDKNFLLPATIVLCLLMFFSWLKLFYEPAQSEILRTQTETRKIRQIERELSEFKARHGDLSIFAAKKEVELDEARKFLPTTLEQDKFIDKLYRAAEISRVSLISVTAGEAVSAKEIQAQVVTVKAEANYIALMNFLREIVDGTRLVSLEKISISGAGILSCDVTFKIFATAGTSRDE